MRKDLAELSNLKQKFQKHLSKALWTYFHPGLHNSLFINCFSYCEILRPQSFRTYLAPNILQGQKQTRSINSNLRSEL